MPSSENPELQGPAAPESVGRRLDDTVVFLFTDIEASTRRWEGDQNAMAADLARHDEVLQAAVQETGGRVFAHTGDGMCTAFPTSATPVTAGWPAPGNRGTVEPESLGRNMSIGEALALAWSELDLPGEQPAPPPCPG